MLTLLVNMKKNLENCPQFPFCPFFSLWLLELLKMRGGVGRFFIPWQRCYFVGFSLFRDAQYNIGAVASDVLYSSWGFFFFFFFIHYFTSTTAG
ncbi:hypothetical protein I7I52_09269 [Histoplasma capsulatum]|uniref:Uncharacterized protein n=1 Tax=Ajellomyces capsulatus TaxID=5037 RepID=A0A8H7YXV5_AJECA|nr:hypothetical protein I7I52_09269 [Histoplasma capsulatum]